MSVAVREAEAASPVIEPSLLGYGSKKQTMAVDMRGVAVRAHVPSNVYADREQAIVIVRGGYDHVVWSRLVTP